ncbi:MAG: hypothetical protein H6741_33930 [Alphaproteobacteria bacterium]|nr:hypothetical protein [Alphaproteobacteria bacterium]MCB9797718.1 hypothetical protein [Alphaproteobacteria bacterium]
MRLISIFAVLALAGCPAPPEQPTGGPPPGQQGATNPAAKAGKAGKAPEGQPGEAGPPPGEGGQPPGEGGPAADGPKEPGGPGGPPPVFEIEGESVKVSGQVVAPDFSGGTIVVEVLRNEEGIGQPIRLHVVQMTAPGPFSFDAPKDLGEVNMIAYVGDAEKGPQQDSAQGYADPINVTTEAIDGVTITLGGKGEKGKPEDEAAGGGKGGG